MRFTLIATLIAVLSLSGLAQAQNNTVVVELYTSQGCSSCPPADKLLKELGKNSHVIALALHVDYWDYLGWTDTFSNHAYTLRQRAYARSAHKRTIYTPQMIVQGLDHVVGTHAQDVKDSITLHRKAATLVDLKVTRTGNSLMVTASPRGQSVGATEIQLVRYIPEQTVAIGRGENRGQKISYSNIVVGWGTIGSWNGRSDFLKSVVISGSEPLVVIVQKSKDGPILAAVRLN